MRHLANIENMLQKHRFKKMMLASIKLLCVPMFITTFLFSGCHKDKEKIMGVEENRNYIEITQDEKKQVDNTSSETNIEKIVFTPLALNEGIYVEIKMLGSNSEPDIFAVYAKSENIRELFTLAMLSFNDNSNTIEYSTPINGMSKSVVFAYMTIPDKLNPIQKEICYVNGNDGFANIMRVPNTDLFKIDSDCKYICIDESSNIPIVCIYDLLEMKSIKTIQYEPHRDKGMYPVKMSYFNNVFKVMLSADTVFFAILEIPIDDTNNYRVIDSYTEEDMQQGKSFIVPKF